ncbi:MAG: preprotein translocase subunit SecE [Micrococcales bacterium]|jgi:preprotein translocase subunit SecE|nr:preprotein translocase subunit SecE [Micrococcales bacterium]
MAEELQPTDDLVEKAKADRAATRNIFGRTALFFRQVYAELRKVTRPTYKELVSYTGVVLAFVVLVMVILAGMDFVFLNVVTFLFTPTA